MKQEPLTRKSRPSRQLFGPRMELPGGLLLKQLGKVAQWSDTEVGVEDWDVRVVLDSIEVDPQCDGLR
jgi:hypothetical protein